MISATKTMNDEITNRLLDEPAFAKAMAEFIEEKITSDDLIMRIKLYADIIEDEILKDAADAEKRDDRYA